jgi:hypothetical protein
MTQTEAAAHLVMSITDEYRRICIHCWLKAHGADWVRKVLHIAKLTKFDYLLEETNEKRSPN